MGNTIRIVSTFAIVLNNRAEIQRSKSRNLLHNASYIGVFRAEVC